MKNINREFFYVKFFGVFFNCYREMKGQRNSDKNIINRKLFRYKEKIYLY